MKPLWLVVLALAAAACGADDVGAGADVAAPGADGSSVADVAGDTGADAAGADAAGDVGADTAGDVGDDAAEDVADVEADATLAPTVLPEPDGVRVRFAPGSDDFFDLGFPSDLRRRPDGALDFTGWPTLMDNAVLKMWLPAAEELVHGWGLTSGVNLWLSGPIDAASLPVSAGDTVWVDGQPAPTLFLMDVDPSSAERGRSWPLELSWRSAVSVTGPAFRLMALPTFGLIRRPLTRYALVVTTAVAAQDGAPLVQAAALGALLGGSDAPIIDHWGRPVDPAPYQETAAYLADRGLPVADIASMTLFTTGDPAARLLAVAAWGDTLPVPEIQTPGLVLDQVFDDYVVLAGRHSAPFYQAGKRPFAETGGQIVFGDDGKPVISEQQWVRFNVCIPRAPMPPGGWPMMLYMHGSGGEWRQVIDRGQQPGAPPGSGPALIAAQHGTAAMGFDFPLHGDRSDPPDTTGLYLYNLLGNPRATVDNFIVSAVELTLRARLIAQMTVDPAIAPEYLDAGGAPDGLIRFDAGAITAMGQSMGSTIGVPFGTIDKTVDAMILSGSGGVLIEIASTAVEPIPLKGPLEILLGYTGDEHIDRFDPMTNLLQHYWDLVDPVAHARYLIGEPHPGIPAKHVYQSSGLEDGYFSTHARAALALALGLDALVPTLEPELDGLLALGGGTVLTGPVKGNRGGVTAVVTQFAPDVPGSGHDALFRLDEAKAHYGCFLTSVAAGGVPSIASIAEAMAGCP